MQVCAFVRCQAGGIGIKGDAEQGGALEGACRATRASPFHMLSRIGTSAVIWLLGLNRVAESVQKLYDYIYAPISLNNRHLRKLGRSHQVGSALRPIFTTATTLVLLPLAFFGEGDLSVSASYCLKGDFCRIAVAVQFIRECAFPAVGPGV